MLQPRKKGWEKGEEEKTRITGAPSTAQPACAAARSLKIFSDHVTRNPVTISESISTANSRRAHPLAEVAYVFPGTAGASELGGSRVREKRQAKFSPRDGLKY